MAPDDPQWMQRVAVAVRPNALDTLRLLYSKRDNGGASTKDVQEHNGIVRVAALSVLKELAGVGLVTLEKRARGTTGGILWLWHINREVAIETLERDIARYVTGDDRR